MNNLVALGSHQSFFLLLLHLEISLGLDLLFLFLDVHIFFSLGDLPLDVILLTVGVKIRRIKWSNEALVVGSWRTGASASLLAADHGVAGAGLTGEHHEEESGN